MPPDSISDPLQTKTGSHSKIIAVVLVYALFAGLWILLSDTWVQIIFSTPEHIILASMLKGWLFVGVTSLLLYGLMRRWLGGDGLPATNLRPGLPFALIATAIIALSGIMMVNTINYHKETELARLQAIADAKTSQIADWLAERQGDANFVQTSELFAEQYQRWQTWGDQHSADPLQKWLEQFRQNRGYRAIMLLKPNAEKLWGSDEASQIIAPSLLAATQSASTARKVRRVGPYRDIADNLRLDFVAPLTAMPGPAPVIVLHIDPTDWLFPMLQTWPTPSTSGEALLFRRDGDQILYLSELRHQKNTAARLRIPVATQNLLAAQALLGKVPLNAPTEGVDYRGIPAVGIVRSIPGTDWFLLAKLDQHELYAAANVDMTWIGFVCLLLICTAAACMYLLRQHQQLLLAARIRQDQADRLRNLSLLAAIADSSDDAIFAKDLEGRYVFFNPAACRFVGKSAEQVLGCDDRNIFPAEQAELLISIGQKVIAEGSTCTQEEALSTIQGEQVFLATKGPLRAPDGNIIGIFGISRNITERKHIELALAASAQRFRKLFNQTPIALAIIAQDGAVVAVNKRFVNTFGYTPADVPTLAEWWPQAYPDPDYRRMVMDIWAAAVQQAAAQHTDIEPLELKIVCKDGSVCDVVISGTLIETDILVILSDITERRAVEEALRSREQYQRAVLDNFPFMVWLKDTHSRILAANKAYAQIAGVADTELLIGKTDSDFWAPELAEQYLTDDQVILASGQAKVVEEEITEAERRFWIETYKSPVELDGRIIGTVGFARDITERKRAETELRQRNSELERFNRAMIGRELDMIALKQQVNALSRQLDQPAPYPLDFLNDDAATQAES
ncbi:MAG: PAS domain S-box protein [Methylovulum sp.]|nr:PAS domain S-box protein [Methylovulum sp.]